MRNDTELLKELLGHFSVYDDDLDYAYNDACNGLRDAGASVELVTELIQRRSELYGAVANGSQQPHTAICSCGIWPVRGGNLYCDMCLADGKGDHKQQ
jgi:hypothetical protein